MEGQVGGISAEKRRLLTMGSSYVLKPLHLDHRGPREVGFYEAIDLALQEARVDQYLSLVDSSIQGDQWMFESSSSLAKWMMTPLGWLGHSPSKSLESKIQRALGDMEKEMHLLKQLSTFTPKYYGVLSLNNENRQSIGNLTTTPEMKMNTLPNHPYGLSFDSYLVLNNITEKFSKPCAIDIKVGTKSYEPDASFMKRQSQIDKYPWQESIGFRICGMRIYDPHGSTEEYRYYDKKFGQSLASIDAVRDALRIFFTVPVCDATHETTRTAAGTRTMIRTMVVSNVLFALGRIQKWFQENDRLSFYASSILIVYEGDCTRGCSTDTSVDVKMIDFGRVRRQGGGDPGYAFGLEKLRTTISEL